MCHPGILYRSFLYLGNPCKRTGNHVPPKNAFQSNPKHNPQKLLAEHMAERLESPCHCHNFANPVRVLSMTNPHVIPAWPVL